MRRRSTWTGSGHLARYARPVPIVTWGGLRVHRVATHDTGADEAVTHCGLRIDRAAVLIECARDLARPRPCRNCDRAERGKP